MPISHVVVPVDFSEKSEGAARYAEAMHRRFGSRITLLHVLPPPHYEFGAMEVGGSVLEDLFRNRSEQAKTDLDQFLLSEMPADATERLLADGDPAAIIVERAHDLGAGLIIMPTHGYGTFRRFILGSVTAKVLHDADCPVWTLSLIHILVRMTTSRSIPFFVCSRTVELAPFDCVRPVCIPQPGSQLWQRNMS